MRTRRLTFRQRCRIARAATLATAMGILLAAHLGGGDTAQTDASAALTTTGDGISVIARIPASAVTPR